MELKTSKVTHIKVKYDDLDRFIEHIYGVDEYSFVAEQEANNYSSYDFTVDGELDEWDEEELRKFVEKKSDCGPATILNDMCRREIIEPGEYLIEVYW